MSTNGNGRTKQPKPHDYRCACGRLLFRAILPAGAYVETRCPKCGRMYVWPAPVAVVVVEQVAVVEMAN